MGRKNLLQDLIRDANEAPTKQLRPRQTKGAIGAVSKSIADLKSRSVTDLHADQIKAAGMQDRLEEDKAADAALIASIREHGQQVPVLVRPHPADPDCYQIVYGRRRVAALRALGLPVKALIRDLDDKALIIAQGQENAARQNLSFIEKVNFARQMKDAGYDRKTICAALHIDKTVISRMLKISDKVPVTLIEAIGAAPNVGRNRWGALAETLAGAKIDVKKVEKAAFEASKKNADAAFEAAFKMAKFLSAPRRGAMAQQSKSKRRSRDVETRLQGAGGKTIGVCTKTSSGFSLRLSDDDGFADWLTDNLPVLHADWTNARSKS